VFKWFFLLFVITCVALGWAGSKPPEGVPLHVARIATAWYFIHFIIVLPLLGWFERPRPLPRSIGEPVLGGGHVAAAGAAKPMEKA
jgi:ubiquinol-cytochrome c reductase cytochrome b subunit